MSIFLSILGGISVYFLVHIFLKPVIDLRKCIGEICGSLIYYANIYSTSAIDKNAEEKLRQQATLIMEKAHLIKYYRFFVCMTLIPKMENIKIAHRNLIGLSNCINDKDSTKDNERRKNEIIEALNLKILEKEN